MQMVERKVPLSAALVSRSQPTFVSPEKPMNSSNRRMRLGRTETNFMEQREGGREERRTGGR